MELIYSIVLIISGFAIGFVGGLVGLVLGVVRYPIVLNVEPTFNTGITAGTNLGVSTLGAVTAAIRHYHQGNIQLRPFLILAGTGALGAFIGSFMTGYFPSSILLAVVGIIVSYEAIVLIRSARKKEDEVSNHYNNERGRSNGNNAALHVEGNTCRDGGKNFIRTRSRLIILESVIGFGVGVLGGLVGLVLGSIRMPAMISILRMEPSTAIGTNLAAASVMGVFGLIGHIINNNIDYTVLILMGSGAMVGGYLGARYTNRFSERGLKQIIGMVLIIVAITMFIRTFQVGTDGLG